MKYFIIGLHGSGKQDVIDHLKQYDIKCGKLFSNLDEPNEHLYNWDKYETYNITEINTMFENNAYIFMQEIPGCECISSCKYFEGLSRYEFDTNEVFVLSPDQLLNISPNAIKEPVCFIWLDNNLNNRKHRYLMNEKLSYNFNERESIEKHDIDSFVKALYNFNNSHVIYFTNEEPERIAAITYSMIKHPDLIDIYVKNFV